MPDTITKSVEAYANLSEAVILKLLQMLWGLWSPFDQSDWWDDNLVAGNAAKSATLVTSALHRVRLDQRSYSTSVFKQLNVGLTRLPSLSDGYARSNVTPFEVYQRPAKEYRFLTSQGLVFDEARMRAKTRLESLAKADALKTQMDESQRLNAANPKVIGTRRIIHPELSKSGTCGLCLVASTRFYKKSDLQAIHDGCHCTTLSITAASDPGLKMNRDDLKAIYAAAGSSGAQDLLNTRITVNEHGELGPLLVREGQHFKTAEEAGRPAYVKQTPETIRAARVKERDEINQALAKAESDYSKLTPGATDAIRVFRAIKNMKERLASIDRFLKTL